MQERSKSSTDCRFGFQGQELDNEIKGKGNSVNYKYRMQSPRVGRFFAVDPLSSEYPFYSPYSFSGNRVIDSYELEGAEPLKDEDGKINSGFKPVLILNLPDGGQITAYEIHGIYVISKADKRRLQLSGMYGSHSHREYDHAYGGMNGGTDLTEEGAIMNFQVGGSTITSDYPYNQYESHVFQNPGMITQTIQVQQQVQVPQPLRQNVPNWQVTQNGAAIPAQNTSNANIINSGQNFANRNNQRINAFIANNPGVTGVTINIGVNQNMSTAQQNLFRNAVLANINGNATVNFTNFNPNANSNQITGNNSITGTVMVNQNITVNQTIMVQQQVEVPAVQNAQNVNNSNPQ